MNRKVLERQITLEKFQTLTASLYLSLAAQVAVAIIIAIYLSDKISRLHFTALCATFISLIIGCLIVGAFYHRDKTHQKTIQNHDRHMGFATFFSFALGAFWSSIALSQLYAPLNQQVILILILLGQSAASVLALAPNMRLFYAGVPVSLLPLGIGFIWLNDQVHTILGVLLLLFFIFITYVARAVNKLVTESIRLRLINETLLADKSQLLASASHDLRQPLHALSLYISALEQNNNTNPGIITKIRYTIQSLQSLFDGLLNLSKLDANASKPKMQNVYWGDLKKQLLDEFSILAKQKNIRIHWEDQYECFISDPLLLEQIIRNLVGNAIQYTSKGSISLNCTKDPHQPNKIQINITDTGIGIKPQHQCDIFNAYHSIKNTHSNTKNPGLGLSIAKRLATAMEHELSLSSQYGHGSCFSISLNAASVNKNSIETPDASTYFHQNQQEMVNILLIDNDIPSTTKQLLLSWGCNVLNANTLIQAAECIKEQGCIPDGIILNATVVDDQALGEYQNIPIMMLEDHVNNTNPNHYRVQRHQLKPAILRAFIINIRCIPLPNTEKATLKAMQKA
ncbi:hypothetical protein A9Q81_07115 [Gammaproteobacteria bacterium 42_54_T18]|nr:hypothetical protein A9Q81_07115 [Gammaproteobacteria bacterium 42_54_T18]